MIAVNKADDGEQELAARVAARELFGALKLVRGSAAAPPVVTYSGLYNKDLDVVWGEVVRHRERLGADGLARKRAEQQLDFTWALVRDELDQRLRHHAGVKAIQDAVRDDVLGGRLTAPLAADRILAAYDGE